MNGVKMTGRAKSMIRCAPSAWAAEIAIEATIVTK